MISLVGQSTEQSKVQMPTSGIGDGGLWRMYNLSYIVGRIKELVRERLLRKGVQGSSEEHSAS